MGQPIIRGIQAVGSVNIRYRYNSSDGKLVIPTNVMQLGGSSIADNNTIETGEGGVDVAGFRLDGEFLRAVQQVATSAQIPILGGGAVALTNNNRSGSLSINATKVSTPVPGNGVAAVTDAEGNEITAAKDNTANTGAMYGNEAGTIGPVGNVKVYDLVFLAQVQQAQEGGDSVGATITVDFMFCGLHTTIEFQGCTIAAVDPLGLSGNDAVNYNVSINYLNWTCNYSNSNGVAVTA